MILSRQLISRGLLLQNSKTVLCSAYHVDGLKKPTMDDLPLPQGDWKEEYHRQNSKYNAVLISGIVALVGTIFLSKSLGVPEMNASIPKLDD